MKKEKNADNKLKDIVKEQLENEDATFVKEELPAKSNEEMNQMLSKELSKMNVKKKTRGAEIIGIFAMHNFYAGGFDPVELRTTLEDLGPTYVKIGQIISSRTDILPERYCEELVKLRQNVQPLDSAVARAVIEQETGKKIDEIYSEFQNEPLGSASIGQVHYGVLKDGTKVVTKVQRPLISEMMAEDFVLLKKLAGLVNVVAEGDDDGNMIDLYSVIEELEAVTNDELDFRIEAENTKFFRENCIEDESVITCPDIIEELSTDKILTQTYVDGYSITNKDKMIRDGYDLEAVGHAIVENYVHQVLDVGTFHADPHQGNIMISNGVPYWIDFGMIGTISDSNITMVQKIILGVLQGDIEMLASAAMSMGTVSSKTDKAKLMTDLDEFINQYMTGTSIADVNVDDMLSSFADLASNNHIKLPSEFTMLLRSLIMVEGVIEELCPELNLFELLSNKLLNRAKRNFDLKKELLSIGEEAVNIGMKASQIPALAADTLKDIVKGNLKVNLVLTGYEGLVDGIVDLTRSIVFAVFACVLFFGSCILCQTDIEPQVANGMPLLAVAGFLFSIALGIYSVKQLTKKK